MKIAFVNSRYEPYEFGGAEKTVRVIAEKTAELGHDVTVISIARDDRTLPEILNGVKTRYIKPFNVFLPPSDKAGKLSKLLWSIIDSFNPVMARRIGELFDDIKPDIVNTNNLLNFSSSVWSAAESRRIPLVHMAHDYYLGCINSSMFVNGENCVGQCMRCKIIRTPTRALSSKVNSVIFVSAKLAEKTATCEVFGPATDQFVVRGVSSLPRIAVHPTLPNNSRLHVGFLGRIEKTKGVEWMLDGINAAKNVQAVIAGTGEESYLDGLRKRFSGPKFSFLGYVRAAELLTRIDVLVVPSLWEEPLGAVIFEAYAHGIPVIVSRSGGMPEIVDEGRTGFIVEPGDSAGLALLLDGLDSKELRHETRHACLLKSKEFSVDVRLPQLLEIWNATIAKQKAHVSHSNE